MGIQQLTIFQTSDEHGHLANAGRIAALVNKARTENPGGVILVSSGDFFSGSAESDQLGPKPSQDILNASPYDLMAVGNHEIDLGADYLRQWVKESKATVVAANLTDRDTSQLLEGSEPYAVKWLKGIPVGFFGVTTPDTESLAYPGIMGSLHVGDPIAPAAQAVENLHAQGVKVIFALSHLGDGDTALARAIPNIEILGGHTHAPWTTPQTVNGDAITRPGAFRSSLERIDLSVDSDTWDLVSAHYSLVPITPDMPEDDVVGPIVAQAEEAIKVAGDEVLGTVSRPLTHDDRLPDDFDPVLTGLMCKASGADLAVINKQFVRQSLAAGVLKVAPWLDSMPFTNRLEVTTVSAGDVCRMMALSGLRHDETSLALGFAGHRYSLHDGQLWDESAGRRVPDDQPVKIASTDYLIGGGLRYFQPMAAQGVAPCHDGETEHPRIRDVFRQAVASGAV